VGLLEIIIPRNVHDCIPFQRHVGRMQQAFQRRIAWKVCDFTLLHIVSHYDDLFRDLRRRGTVVASFVHSVQIVRLDDG
jgi:hypothetical protein